VLWWQRRMMMDTLSLILRMSNFLEFFQFCPMLELVEAKRQCLKLSHQAKTPTQKKRLLWQRLELPCRSAGSTRNLSVGIQTLVSLESSALTQGRVRWKTLSTARREMGGQWNHGCLYRKSRLIQKDPNCLGKRHITQTFGGGMANKVRRDSLLSPAEYSLAKTTRRSPTVTIARSCRRLVYAPYPAFAMNAAAGVSRSELATAMELRSPAKLCLYHTFILHFFQTIENDAMFCS
jgi:hypothetical protein